MIASGHADLGLNTFAFSTERLDVIDFLTQFTQLRKHEVCIFQTLCDYNLHTIIFRTQQHFLRTTESAGH